MTTPAERIISSINAAAIAGELSTDDVRRIYEATQRVFRVVQQDAKRELYVGMPVTFQGKDGLQAERHRQAHPQEERRGLRAGDQHHLAADSHPGAACGESHR